MEYIGYFILAIIAYNIPSLIAFFRFHPDSLRIIVLNISLGWTVIGWFGSLVWAFMPVPKSRIIKP